MRYRYWKEPVVPRLVLKWQKSFASRIDANPGMVGDELDPALIARQPIDKLFLWLDCSGPIKSFSAINQSRCRCPPNKTAARKLRYDRLGCECEAAETKKAPRDRKSTPGRSNQEHQLGKLPCREATARPIPSPENPCRGPRDAATSGAVGLLQVMGRPSSARASFWSATCLSASRMLIPRRRPQKANQAIGHLAFFQSFDSGPPVS